MGEPLTRHPCRDNLTTVLALRSISCDRSDIQKYDGATILTLVSIRCDRANNQKYDGATVLTLMSIRCDRSDTQKYDGATVLTLMSIRGDRSDTQKYDGATVLTLYVCVSISCFLVTHQSSPQRKPTTCSCLAQVTMSVFE